jgi:hypothetical protein
MKHFKQKGEAKKKLFDSVSKDLNQKLDNFRRDNQNKHEELHRRESNLHKLKEEALNMKGMGDQIKR